MQPPRGKAFTIIELLVTISIIGILLAATGIGLSRARVTNRDSERVSDILNIAHAIDQAALTARSVYPANGTNYNLVVNSSFNTGLTPQIDTSLFANHQIPSDPIPGTPTCASVTYLCGYVYTNRTGGAGNGLTRTLPTQYEYVLQVGLEGDRFNDEQSLTTPSPAVSSNGRTEYYYFGPACGTAASNTCTIQ